MIEILKEDTAVQAAARIGSRFSMDPVAVLSDGGDAFLFAIREAAALIVNDDERKQSEESERKAKAGRSGGGGRRGGRGRRR